MQSVRLEKIAKKLDLELLTPEIDISDRMVYQMELNRPGLQLTGYFEHFMSDRIQVLGKVEYTYIKQLDRSTRIRIFKKMMEYDIPGIIFCRGYRPDKDILRIAKEHGVPLFGTVSATSAFMAELTVELAEGLAPCISMHGVLVDVYGEGILIMGESGVGKSEAALELIRRGHRLVADDVVEIRKINERTLVGTAPEVTRHFIELRGIGIIDCRTLFGVESIKEKQNIDLVIKLEEWNKEIEYDRLGLEDAYTNILGIDVVCQDLPEPCRDLRGGRRQPSPEKDGIQCGAGALSQNGRKHGAQNAGEKRGRGVLCHAPAGVQG